MDVSVVSNLAVAGLAGLAVGIEREWSGHTRGPDARFAGARTFLLLGGVGGVAGLLMGSGYEWAAAALLAGAGALAVTAYVMAMRRPGSTTDGTTEMAALAVLAVGTLAGLGFRTLASGATAIIAVALAEKSRVQYWLGRLDDQELRGALQFAVLALVVLPLIPTGAYGPYGAVRPRELWIVVLLFSGLNFAGYIARQSVGAARGYGVTGLLGGLVSSTAVTLQFSRQSRAEPSLAEPLGLGVVAACTVLVPRVAIVSALLEPPVARALLPFLAPPFLVGVCFVALVLWRARRRGPDHPDSQTATVSSDGLPSVALPTSNPLGLMSSIRMAILFQVVLLAVAWLQAVTGSAGVLLTAGVLGLTDMDALTLSMARLGAEPTMQQLAATAIAVGLLANSVLKLTVTLVLGTSAFQRRASLGLIALALASIVGLALGRGLPAWLGGS